MSNTWGKGGLFEQALASKLDRQASETALNRSNVGVNMMNAQTSRMDVGNRYDLGLRADKIAQGQLDVNRGQLGVNRQNADTSRFGAETQRLTSSGGIPVAQSEASNLGLRTFNPISDSAFKSFVEERNAAIPSIGTRPTPMKNGGMVLKPKMVKQPGYMHGGKVKMPEGYKAGGTIGDVAKDDGTDKVDVVAREGEYFLNPETVATAFGGGDYEQGIRKLDNIVRRATGKEPGPSPVGKEDKPGLASSGAVPLLSYTPGTELIGGAEVNRPNWTFGRAVPPTPPVAQAPLLLGGPPPVPPAPPVEPPGKFYEYGKKLGGGARTVATKAAKGGPLLYAAPIAGFGDYEIDDPEAEKSMVANLRKGAVEAGLDSLSGIAKTVDFATGLVGANMDLSGRLRRKVEADLGPMLKNNKTYNPPSERNENYSNEGLKKEPVKSEAAPAAEKKEPSLRDMMMARLGGIDAYTGPFASMVQRGAQGERMKLIDNLSKLEEQGMQVAGARMAGAAKAAADAREDADKRIDERYQIPKYDKDGRIVGYEKDPEASKGVRDFAAQMFGQDGRPFDFYALSKEQQDKAMLAYDINNRGTRRLNERFAKEGGASARTSMVPRMNNNALRADGEISIGDILDPNISLGDWLTSWGSNKMEKQRLLDPVTGQRVSARHVLMREDGTIDQDLVDQMNRAAGQRQ